MPASLVAKNNDLQTRISDRIETAVSKFTQQDDCWSDSSAPRIASITVDFINNGGHAISDYLLKFPFPVTRFWISSIADVSKNNSYLAHFDPFGKVYPGNSIDPDGSEPWIPLIATTDPGWNNVLVFKKPISQIYVDIGFEDGGGSHKTTFMFCDDSFKVEYFPRNSPSA